MTVLEEAIEKCRAALGAGIPILYIKTESWEIIRQIVDSDRLVVRLCGKSAGPSWGGARLWREHPTVEIANYSEGKITAGAVKNYSTWTYPHIHVCKADPNWGRAEFQYFEEYIRDHENKNFSNYKILQSSAVILFSSQVVVSTMMQMYTEFIEISLPDREEIRSEFLKEAYLYGDTEIVHNEKYINEICTEFAGFTGEELHMTMQKIMRRETENGESPLRDAEKVISLIRDHKKGKMQNGILTLRTDTDAAIGGMENLTGWLESQKAALNQAEMLRRKKGIQPPKGVLVCGIPGCGKSEAAKATARTFDLPLLQMDVGRLMNKFVGESEHNMDEALRLAETMSPCILWIDELDKGFSAAGSGSNKDAGTFKRMFAKLLGWMQDNKKPCFIFATANNISGLPKEFFRSGRFDAVYGMYLPTAEECVKIFIARMEKIQKDVKKTVGTAVFLPECMDKTFLRRIVDSCLTDDGVPRIVVGADIQKIVNTALTKLQNSRVITQDQWGSQLKVSIKECGVYGDGFENVDSIAVSYCRMLRKGMKPAGDVLFRPEDYQAKKLESQEDSEDVVEVLGKSLESDFFSGYDKAVYELLRTRINVLAPQVEKFERQQIIMG